MNVLRKITHFIKLPISVTYQCKFIVVKDIAADGFIASDLMQASNAITGHAHNVVYFNSSKAYPPILSQCTSVALASTTRTFNLSHLPTPPPSAKVYLTSSVHIKPQCKRVIALSSQSALTFDEGIVEPDNDYFKENGFMTLPGTCHSE